MGPLWPPEFLWKQFILAVHLYYRFFWLWSCAGLTLQAKPPCGRPVVPAPRSCLSLPSPPPSREPVPQRLQTNCQALALSSASEYHRHYGGCPVPPGAVLEIPFSIFSIILEGICLTSVQRPKLYVRWSSLQRSAAPRPPS